MKWRKWILVLIVAAACILILVIVRLQQSRSAVGALASSISSQTASVPTNTSSTAENVDSSTGIKRYGLVSKENQEQLSMVLYLAEQHKLREAEEAIKPLIEQLKQRYLPRWWRAKIMMAQATLFMHQRKTSDAVALYRLVLKKFGYQNRDASVMLGMILATIGEDEEAVVVLKENSRYNQDDYGINSVLAEAYINLGQDRKADKILEKIAFAEVPSAHLIVKMENLVRWGKLRLKEKDYKKVEEISYSIRRQIASSDMAARDSKLVGDLYVSVLDLYHRMYKATNDQSYVIEAQKIHAEGLKLNPSHEMLKRGGPIGQ